MNSGPQKSTIWALEGSRMLTALRRLWGQRSGGPRGVVDQSKARISAPSSPPPSRKEVPPGARLLAGGALGVMGERIAAGGKEARWQGGPRVFLVLAPSYSANNLSRSSCRTGLTRCPLNPAAEDLSRSSAVPQPVSATIAVSLLHGSAPIRRATS